MHFEESSLQSTGALFFASALEVDLLFVTVQSKPFTVVGLEYRLLKFSQSGRWKDRIGKERKGKERIKRVWERRRKFWILISYQLV